MRAWWQRSIKGGMNFKNTSQLVLMRATAAFILGGGGSTRAATEGTAVEKHPSAMAAVQSFGGHS
jgi:exopolysaccharide biosynthesis protein